VVSIEAEKNSNWRHSPISSRDVFDTLGEIDEIPDVICTAGWWPRDHCEGRPVHYFSSSHERSHLLCAFGMSSLPKGTPCYALVWEGEIGAFYEIDSVLNITLLADVLNQVGNRFALLYGLADPTFPKVPLATQARQFRQRGESQFAEKYPHRAGRGAAHSTAGQASYVVWKASLELRPQKYSRSQASRSVCYLDRYLGPAGLSPRRGASGQLKATRWDKHQVQGFGAFQQTDSPDANNVRQQA
jgi:hypothetical protein